MADKYEVKNQDLVELTTVDGDVEIRNCRRLVNPEGDTIVIKGTLRVIDELEVDGNLEVGRLESKSRDRITILGDLKAERAVSVTKGSLVVEGNATARDIDVGASFVVRQNLECVSAKAGGSVKVEGDAKAQRITGGGSVKIEGNVDVERIIKEI